MATGELLYYKCMTPEFLKSALTDQSLLQPGSGDTELKVGTDTVQFDSILDVTLLAKKAKGDPARDDLTVVINVAAEGPKPSWYDPLAVCITDRKNVMGIQLRDPSEYKKAGLGPYMGIFSPFGPSLGNPTIVQSIEKEQDFKYESWLRWPQMFNIKLKPNPTGSGAFGHTWGLCSSAAAGGTSLSYTLGPTLDVDEQLDLVLYRNKKTETYTINMIEVAVYRDAR